VSHLVAGFIKPKNSATRIGSRWVYSKAFAV